VYRYDLGRFKHHKDEVWVQSTQRPSGGDHYDHIFKRFDPQVGLHSPGACQIG
jgi:hypothetical protein